MDHFGKPVLGCVEAVALVALDCGYIVVFEAGEEEQAVLDDRTAQVGTDVVILERAGVEGAGACVGTGAWVGAGAGALVGAGAAAYTR